MMSCVPEAAFTVTWAPFVVTVTPRSAHGLMTETVLPAYVMYMISPVSIGVSSEEKTMLSMPTTGNWKLVSPMLLWTMEMPLTKFTLSTLLIYWVWTGTLPL